MASRKVSRSSNGSSRTISVAFHVVRLLLVVLLALIFLISTVYFIRTIDAIGDDVDEARETHWGHTHEVEETPLNIEGSSGGGGKFDPYEADSAGDREENVASPRGRLVLGKNYNEYAVTRSRAKQQHIVSLIVWVVLTLFAAILSLAGIIGALCGNMCMVLFSACMIFVHAVASHVLPLFEIQLPALTSNWLLLALESPAVLLALLFIGLHRAKAKAAVRRSRQRKILY